MSALAPGGNRVGIAASAIAILVSLSAAQTLPAAEPTRRFIAADSSKNRIAIIDETGRTEWEHKIGSLHDLHVLPGELLHLW